jgi:predicted nucleic acid-binding protein
VPAELFVDTSAWYVLALTSAPEHRKVAGALRQRVERGTRIVTTNLIVAETHALLLRRTRREIALAFAREVRRTPNVVVNSSPDDEESALTDWIEKFDDQPFSLTDAVSFAVMEDRGIREALALDHHFSVAGFMVVPDNQKAR